VNKSLRVGDELGSNWSKNGRCTEGGNNKNTFGPGDPSLPTGIGGYCMGWTCLSYISVLAMHTASYSY